MWSKLRTNGNSSKEIGQYKGRDGKELWKRLRLAHSTAVIFKEISEDHKKFGVAATDDHIDWNAIVTQNSVLPFYILRPNSVARLCWNSFILATIVFVAFYAPFVVAFMGHRDGIHIRYVELSISAVFAMDTFLNFFTAYIEDTGEATYLVTSLAQIARNYAAASLIVDAISMVPVEIIFEDHLGINDNVYVVLRLLRVVRIVRLNRLQQSILDYDSANDLHHGISNAFSIVGFVLIVTHSVACFWFMIGDPSRRDDPELALWCSGGMADDAANPLGVAQIRHCTWVEMNGLVDAPVWAQYVTSSYWAFSTLTTVGYGDISAYTIQERTYSMAMMLVGVTWYVFLHVPPRTSPPPLLTRLRSFQVRVRCGCNDDRDDFV